MRLFIQIPCLNEEKTLPLVLEHMPTQIPGIDDIQLLIIDDGCSDKTVEVARKLGVKHFVHHAKPMGLARAFRDGVDYALKHGADIVVNTDGDNQYPSETIGELVQPIIRHEADIVVGDRQTATIKEFSWFKRKMQHFGSWVVNKAAGTNIPDAASGFRAYSKNSLLKLNIVTEFSYCMETIIQAGNKRIAITSYAITTNPKTRESRLFSNIFEHMAKFRRRYYSQLPDVQIERHLQMGCHHLWRTWIDSSSTFSSACLHGTHCRSCAILTTRRHSADACSVLHCPANHLRSPANSTQTRRGSA